MWSKSHENKQQDFIDVQLNPNGHWDCFFDTIPVDAREQHTPRGRDRFGQTRSISRISFD
jgi:hypothetical protein